MVHGSVRAYFPSWRACPDENREAGVGTFRNRLLLTAAAQCCCRSSLVPRHFFFDFRLQLSDYICRIHTIGQTMPDGM
jgi:hypothetical protein